MKAFLIAILLGWMSVTASAQVSEEGKLKSDAAIQILAKDLGFEQASSLQVVSDSVTITGNREDHSLKLTHATVGNIEILVSGPVGFFSANKKYPVLFLSAGFLSGKDSVKLIQNLDDKILVGYQYPFSQKQIEKDPSLFPKSVRLVPGQIALVLEWLSSQSYVQSYRMHVMGVSLGSLFLPVSLRLAQTRNIYPTSTLLCFGGADIGAIVNHAVPASVNSSYREILKVLSSSLLALYNPKLHLPYLQGSFFTVYATEDGIFPKSTSLEQYDLLPDPKEIHWIEGPHIEEDHPEIIQQTILLVREFLKKFDSI